ncbi:MAG: hypothetical protein RMZ41_019260 [Nostoc sp. DedVER02]
MHRSGMNGWREKVRHRKRSLKGQFLRFCIKSNIPKPEQGKIRILPFTW